MRPELLEHLMENLLNQVMADGKVTPDEKQILESVKNDINRWLEVSRHHFDENANQPLFRKHFDHSMTQRWRNILDHAIEAAQSDGKVTAEEENLIRCVFLTIYGEMPF